jgi:hypothetical protein
MKKYIYPAVIGIVLLSLMSGCSWLKSYGKIRVLSRHEEKVTIQELEKNWQDYTIYYAGSSVGTAAGIMFDPKNDNRVLVGDRWIKIEDKETLSALIGLIRDYIQFDPRLWRILGPDGEFYGYMFFACGHVVIKVVDDRTMYVYDLESPLYMGDGSMLWEINPDIAW